MDQNLMVSPPNIIEPVGDLIRYLPKAVGPSDSIIDNLMMQEIS
jgi:hypothetical protein